MEEHVISLPSLPTAVAARLGGQVCRSNFIARFILYPPFPFSSLKTIVINDPRFVFKVKRANLPTHVPPIHVQTVASAQPSIPPTSALARPPSTVKPASKTSTSALRLPRHVSMVACV